MDSDADVILTDDTPLKLAEGYELWARSVDSDEHNVAIELLKGGRVVDFSAVQPSIMGAKMADKTYCYLKSLGIGGEIATIAVP